MLVGPSINETKLGKVHVSAIERLTARTAWNKGKRISAKPQLKQSRAWSIRTTLPMLGKARDIAVFNFAINSKLRGASNRAEIDRKSRGFRNCDKIRRSINE